MDLETRWRNFDRRIESMHAAMTEAVRREVEWLEKHNFAVWTMRDGKVVDSRFLDEESESE